LFRDLRFAPVVREFRDGNVYSEATFPYAADAARSLGGGSDRWDSLLSRYVLNPAGMQVRHIHRHPARSH
jgi:hypothetical protein